MRLFVYDMLVNVIYYVHVCEQARWARLAGNSAIENVCIIIIISPHRTKVALSIRLGMDQGRRTTTEATVDNTSSGWGLVLRADPL